MNALCSRCRITAGDLPIAERNAGGMGIRIVRYRAQVVSVLGFEKPARTGHSNYLHFPRSHLNGRLKSGYDRY